MLSRKTPIIVEVQVVYTRWRDGGWMNEFQVGNNPPQTGENYFKSINFPGIIQIEKIS